jgi:ABC-type nickel/cobalt efflux system permease component RcnA
MVSKARQKKQNIIQAYNFEFAMVSIIALVIIVFLPIFVDPLLNHTSYDFITVYQKISDLLIGVFGVFAIYTGVRGWEMALKKTHKTVYVIALAVGLLSVIQFLWMGLPTIFS